MTGDRKPWQHQITIEIDETTIGGTTDQMLAFWWNAAQHNPANSFDTSEPGQLAMMIGWEIIRRWLKGIAPELHHHQQKHYYWNELRQLGIWNEAREFVPHIVPPDTRIVRDALADAVEHHKILSPGKAKEYERALANLDALAADQPPAGSPPEDAG